MQFQSLMYIPRSEDENNIVRDLGEWILKGWYVLGDA